MTTKKNSRGEESKPRNLNLKENRNSKRLTIGFIIFAVIVVGIIGYAFLYDKVLKYNKPVAVVGENKINGKDFNQRVRLERNSYILQYNQIAVQMVLMADSEDYVSYYKEQLTQLLSILDDYEYLGEYVLDSMIDEEVVKIEAEKMGITVSEAEVDALMQELFSYYPNGTATPTVNSWVFEPTSTLSSVQKTLVAVSPITQTPTTAAEATQEEATVVEPTATVEVVPTTVEATLSPTATQMSGTATPNPTPTVYTEELYQQNYQEYITSLQGIEVEESVLREYVTNYLLSQKLYAAITADVSRMQDQVWARHILVETQDEAIVVMNRLAGGEDWNTVCNEVTLDQTGAENCGDLGWFAKGQMVAAFEDESFSLDIGEIGNPVESSYGWHIIQVLGHEERSVESDYDFSRLQSNFYDLWFQEATANITIVKNDNWVDHVPSEPSVALDMRVSSN
ncbi:MAG: peptidylprolyl isomerase [Anaerolineaceae bacterium]